MHLPKLLFCFVSLLLSTLTLWAQAEEDPSAIRKGNRAYAQGEYDISAEYYREAGTSARAAFNLGTALFQKEEFEAAAQEFQRAAIQAESPQVQAQAFYNLGNAHLQQEDFQKQLGRLSTWT